MLKRSAHLFEQAAAWVRKVAAGSAEVPEEWKLGLRPLFALAPKVGLVVSRGHAAPRVAHRPRQRLVATALEQLCDAAELATEVEEHLRVAGLSVVLGGEGERAGVLAHLHAAVLHEAVLADEVLQLIM
jgi:hypothetical protein